MERAYVGLFFFCCIAVYCTTDEGTAASSEKQCTKKLFDGRPRDASSKYIKAFDGFWTLDACKSKCQKTQDCEEFRVKKNRWVRDSVGCVLMRNGTTRSGQLTTWYEMHKLVACPGCPYFPTIASWSNESKTDDSLSTLKHLDRNVFEQLAPLGDEDAPAETEEDDDVEYDEGEEEDEDEEINVLRTYGPRKDSWDWLKNIGKGFQNFQNSVNEWAYRRRSQSGGYFGGRRRSGHGRGSFSRGGGRGRGR